MPCFRAEAGAVLLLGEMDLSEFTHVVVTYSVKETFEPDSAGFPACIGLKTAGKPYSRGDAGYDAEDSLALALPEGGPEGLKYERQLILDLSDVDYKGDVYLAACIPEKQYVYIRSLRFCTGKTIGTKPMQRRRRQNRKRQSLPPEPVPTFRSIRRQPKPNPMLSAVLRRLRQAQS